MKLSQLTSRDLERAAKLLKERESLEAKLATINKELDSIGGNEGGDVQRKPRLINAGGGKRGQVKEQVIEILKSAGQKGIALKELANQLGVNSQRISTWFTTTGKKIKEIKRLGRGQYGWVDSGAAAKPEVGPAKKKHTMTDAQRAKIAAGAKKRWAKFRAQKKAAVVNTPAGKKTTGIAKGKEANPF